MSWLLSIIVVGFIYTGSNFPAENVVPQVVVSTPQSTLQGDETEKFEKTYPLNANGRISVDNVNGSIVIEAWDKNEVKLEAVKIADSRERLSQVDVKIDSKPDYLRIETEFGHNRSWNCSGYCRLEVQYKLTVPRGAVLNEIETVNGSVTISNMTNFTKASAVNGTVKALNLRGTAEVETVNGTSEVSFDRLDGNSKISLSTVNGRVNLLIPSDTDATIKAETVNGSISNEFSLPVRKGKYVGRDLYGKLGEGSVRINLESVNGGLNIKRQQDGKTPKPVTNLLNMNEDAEDDKDVEADVAKVSKMNKTIAKSVKESTKIAVAESMKIAIQAPAIAAEAMKEASKAMAENQKEMAKAQREIEKANREIMSQTFPANWGDFASRNIVEKSDSFSVKGNPKVTVNAKNCAVSVRGWDKDEVKYRLTKIVRGAVPKTTDVIVNRSDSEIQIITTSGQKNNAPVPNPPTSGVTTDEPVPPVPVVNGFPATTYRIEVFVPKKSNLRILTDREIRIEGISGSLELNGGDESINVRDSDGKLKIVAADALVRVIGFTGEVDSKTGDGTNFFEGDFAKFSARTVDGKIILTLPEGTDADIQSETEIQAEGFNLTETDGVHRIGKGGKIYQLKADEGEIFIRNAKVLNAKY